MPRTGPITTAAIAIVLVIAATAVRAAPASKPCLQSGSDQAVVEGRLALQEGLGPAAFLVMVPAGVCLDAGDGHPRLDEVRAVQVYATSAEGMQDLYRLAGEKVYVRGRPTGRRAFQQRAPIMMEVLDIAVTK
jgi:hypothetical protein